jgi:hypothetical protein
MKPREQFYRPLHAIGILLLWFVAAILAPAIGAQQCTVKPASIPLGQTVRLRCELADDVSAVSARLEEPLDGNLGGRTVRLFNKKAPIGRA